MTLFIRFLLMSFMAVFLLSSCSSSGPEKGASAKTKAYNKKRRILYSKHNGSCYRALKKYNVSFQRTTPPRRKGTNCLVGGAVKISAFEGIPLSSPATMTCRVALTTAKWVRNSVVPASAEVLQRRVARINHYGTYNCRAIRGGSRKGRLSEHAYGNALDISGFTLENGAKVKVKQHFYTPDSRGAFLRRIGSEACESYNVTLGPNYNSLHRDHFHLDRGLTNSCKP